MKKIVLLSVATLLLLTYQNCSRTRFEGHGSQDHKSATYLNENGTGYGGKVYAAKFKGDEVCPDGTPDWHRFKTLSATEAVLERENCVDLASPRPIDLTAPGTIALYSARPENPFDLYVYNDWIWEAPLPAVPTRPAFVLYVCWGDSAGTPVKMAIKESSNGADPLLFNATAFMNSAEFFLRDMQRQVVGTVKQFQGTDGGDTYSFDAESATYPLTGVVNYSGSKNLSANLSCLSTY